MDIDYLKITATIVLVVTGWIIGHFFTNQRAITTKRRELVTEHLIHTYRVLTHDVANRKLTSERKEKLENLVADVQLFGSSDQVEMAKRLADDIASGKGYDLSPLIIRLRGDMRKELGLTKLSENVRWLRFNA